MDITTVFHASRLILQEINIEEKPKRVLDLVVEALGICDHFFEDVHNKLVVSGADKTLVARLDAAVADPSQHRAIDPVCKLLLMIYRCGEHQFQDSIAIVGGDLFPPLLAAIFFSSSNKDMYNSAVALMERLVRNRIDLRDVPWSRSLLDLFQEIIVTADPGTHDEPISFVLTWMVEGLLLQRQNNKVFLMEHPSLFESMVTKFANTFRPGCAVNVAVCRFMKILALPATNRVLMVKSIHFLRLLFLLLHDDCIETQKIVLEILTLSSLDRVGGTRIFCFLDHKFLEIATKALDNPNLRENSLSFITVLIVHFPGKSLSSKRPNLVRDLTKQAMLGEAHSEQAAKVVVRLAKSLSVNNGKGDLLDAILELCNAKDTRIRVEGANALLAQAQSRPACSFFIVHVPEATAMLANMLLLSNEGQLRGIAAEIVASLALSPLNVKALARNTSLLNALAANATTNSEPINERAQRHSVIAILRLVVHHRSFEAIAQQDNIVQSLCEFGSSGDQGKKLKQAALRGDACLSLST